MRAIKAERAEKRAARKKASRLEGTLDCDAEDGTLEAEQHETEEGKRPVPRKRLRRERRVAVVSDSDEHSSVVSGGSDQEPDKMVESSIEDS